MNRAFVCLLALGVPARLGAQGAEPLRKTDLIRLLSSPLIAKSELADLIRRNCLAFRPTERDWSDLRDLGADADVISSIGGCGVRSASPPRPPAPPAPTGPVPAAPPPAPPAAPPLSATPLASRLVTVVGTDAFVRVGVRRGAAPQPGVTLVLRGSARLSGGASRDVQAVSDDSGLAVFPVPVGRQAGTYRFEVVSAAGGALPGQPAVELVVRPGQPAAAELRPSQLVLGGLQEGPFAVQVALRDSFQNVVPNEPLELRPAQADMGVAVATTSTDSFGRATFVVDAARVRRPGRVELRARGVRVAALDVVFGGPVSSTGTGWTRNTVRRGVPRTLVSDPLVFQTLSVSGRPIVGRWVRFRGQNAQVAPDSAVTDSSGRARVMVTLGSKAGLAIVTAGIESVQKAETLQVYPGPAVELILERDGARVDGGRIVVELGVPFALTLKARDGYGNAVSTASLVSRLQDVRRQFNARVRLVKLVEVMSDGFVSILRFEPTGLGSTDVAISVGLTTSVAVRVVRSRP